MIRAALVFVLLSAAATHCDASPDEWEFAWIMATQQPAQRSVLASTTNSAQPITRIIGHSQPAQQFTQQQVQRTGWHYQCSGSGRNKTCRRVYGPYTTTARVPVR